MSRKRKQGAKTEAPKALEEIRPRRFTPRPCTACTALRPNGVSYSAVYHTSGNLRYCKCKFCGNTWSQYLDFTTTTVVDADSNAMKESESMPSSVHGIHSNVTVTN